MNQTASTFARQESALHVSFVPSLMAKPIGLPKTDPEFCLVIAQSFAKSVKHNTAPLNYNLRVVECSLAAAVLHAILQYPKPLSHDITPQEITLHELQSAYFDNNPAAYTTMEEQLNVLIKLVEKRLVQENDYTREEIAILLSLSIQELEDRFMAVFPVHAKYFKLCQRALHVFTEAKRVEQFMQLLKTSPDKLDMNLGMKLG